MKNIYTALVIAIMGVGLLMIGCGASLLVYLHRRQRIVINSC